MLAERWIEARPLILAELDNVEAEYDMIYDGAMKDSYKWHSLRIFYQGFEECREEVFEWCRNRILWLDGAFSLD